MPLVIEDGSGLSNAESYVSVADADTYVTAYKGANTLWDAATEGAKEVAARQSTQYVDGTSNWKGEIESSTQALDWPRNYVYDEIGTAIDGLPVNVANATAEGMFLIITGETLTANVSRDDQIKRDKVDVLETEWIDGATYQTTFPELTRWLSGYTKTSGRTQRG